ncbi:MAG TPA: DNA repair protein RecN [Vicinamibacterales bacterium]|nr:DNA repair protein RecN [Vicinamibacterales bacterium]
MLRFLSVRHLAVIEHVEIEFEPGLNVLTGETGAGKSIVVGAIDLLTGGRASAELVRTGESLATVQAIFERPRGGETIVRREISNQGRSRAFIDDTLATTAALRDLGASLIDLHGQHEHQALLDPAEHVDLLDAFAGHHADVAAVSAQYEAWRTAVAALDRTRLDAREKRARIDLASFELQEIDKIAPQPDEDERLAADRTVLANADRLSRLSSEAYAALYEGEGAALGALSGVWKRVGELAALDARFGPYLQDRDELKSRLEDLAFFLRSYGAGLEASPDRLQAVEDRLAGLERLKKKYGPALSNVLARQQALREELAALEAGDERAAALEAREHEARAAFLGGARTLGAARRAAARRLGQSLQGALAELAMPHAKVEVRLVDVSDEPGRWTASGVDEGEFFLSPNPGEELRPLARIASGGELSRVMLALRTLAARDEPGRTLVFDEVDAGIGGAAADAVGARLQTLARRHQILSVTHLPQIAARADAHFQIAKHVRGGRTTTSLARLDEPGREEEIARMIAGVAVSPAVLASAREMLHTRRGEAKAKGESESSGRAKGRRGA